MRPTGKLCFHALIAWRLALGAPGFAAEPAPVWDADLGEVRRLAGTMPGTRPLRINVVTVAESRRTRNFAVKGSPATPSVQARTAYQVVFPDGAVMIDSGMDRQVHRFFGRGVEEPYFPEAAKAAERALENATAVFLTHEHGDHAAGIVKSPRFSSLAPKTTMTSEQVRSLMAEPQMPELRLTQDMAARLRVIEYDRYFAAAPGMVLIKAPGHTPGSQMIYVALQSGREYLFAGDVAWHMDGVRQRQGKDAPWIREPEDLMTAQLSWLNRLMRTEPALTIVISHDDEQRRAYVEQGLLGSRLE